MSHVSSTSSSKLSLHRVSGSKLICTCGACTCYHTSRTGANPCRRFLCYLYDGDCVMNVWADTSICPKCEMVLLALVRTINMKEKMAKTKGMQVTTVLGISWLLFVVYVINF
ncbi:hypothetical protein Hanom_Chr07g00600671 [Helianthus anomalus]